MPEQHHDYVTMTDSSRLISVIVVTYHTGVALMACLESLIAQSIPIEVIVVNNGNPDDVERDLIARASSTPRFVLLTGHGNVGFAKACNLGAAAARGDIVAFVNPDCTVRPDAFERFATYAARFEGKGHWMLGPSIVDSNGRPQRGSRRALLTLQTAFVEFLHLQRWFPQYQFNFHTNPLPKKMTNVPAISGAFMVMPRASFEWIEGFDEGYFLHVEDLDLCLRFSRAGGRIGFVPEIVVTHRGGTSDAPKAVVEKHKARGFMRYFHKNFGHTWPQPILWLFYALLLLRCGVIALKECWRNWTANKQQEPKREANTANTKPDQPVVRRSGKKT